MEKMHESIGKFQNHLHKASAAYLNGGFDRPGFMLYPFRKKVSPWIRKDLEAAARFLSQVDRGSGHKAAGHIASRPSKAIAEMHVAFGRMLESGKFGAAGVTQLSERKGCSEFRIPDYPKADRGYLSPVASLQEYAQKKLPHYLASFHVQGSIATGDYVKGWSDLDTFAVVKKKCMEDAGSLERLRDLLYRSRIFQHLVDPLQHHGHHLVAEHDFAFYPETFMPIETLSMAKSLLGKDGGRRIMVRDSSSDAAEALEWFSRDLLGISSTALKGGEKLSNYDLKFMLHKLALYPSIFLASQGIYRYKKFSFKLAKKYFSKNAWKCIDMATSLRRKWKNASDIRLLTAAFGYNPVLAYQANAKLAGAFQDLRELNGVRIHEIMGSFSHMAREAKKAAKKVH